MKSFKIVIILLFISITGYQTATAQGNQFVASVVSDEEPVLFAYVYNKTQKVIVQTNDNGMFALPSAVGDTMNFSCLGYKDTSFVVSPDMLYSDEIVKIKVFKTDYALNEVKVVRYFSYASFQQAFLNLKLDDKNKPMTFKVKIDPMDLAVNKQFNQPGSTGFGVTLPGIPFHTKSEIQQRRFDEYEKKYSRYNELVSHENISAFTGLKGDSLNAFIIYLRTQVKIKPEADDYSIMMSVKMAYEDFLSYNISHPDTILVK
jgi:hypothetical protein